MLIEDVIDATLSQEWQRKSAQTRCSFSSNLKCGTILNKGDLMKAAVYAGTRNIYNKMLAPAKSLLIHSDVDKIYFLIEDDTFPYDLPKEIECINISKQPWFKKDGPNFANVLSYMVLLRAAYTKIFPHLDKILSIDVDTIVNENISDLWDLDLTNYYLAAVEEQSLTKAEGSYINMGVAMLNLDKIRKEGKDDELIDALNTYWYRFKEQDCINEFFRGQILILPSDYNACLQAEPPQREKITHFAGLYDLDKFPHFNYYRDLPLEKIVRNIPTHITLDIIIPTYKNKKGLRRTLNSITFSKDINVIVIDDCSNLDYSDILNDYPFIQFYQLETNQGPGMARQYGIEHSNGTYITFLDTGDYFYENGLENILKAIKENTYIKLYTWSYVYDNKNILSDKPDDKTIGSVYKRSFIEMYNIHFSKEGSYANEDYGFSRACRLILDDWERYGFSDARKHIKIPVFYEHIDKNSLTKNNNCEFFYTKLSPGIIINGIHAINIAKKAGIKIEYLLDEYNYIMAQEYFFFLCNIQERPELADDTWQIIRNFYFNHYKCYEKFALKTLSILFSQVTLPRIRSYSKRWKKAISFNIIRFIDEIRQEQFVPIRYFQ